MLGTCKEVQVFLTQIILNLYQPKQWHNTQILPSRTLSEKIIIKKENTFCWETFPWHRLEKLCKKIWGMVKERYKRRGRRRGKVGKN